MNERGARNFQERREKNKIAIKFRRTNIKKKNEKLYSNTQRRPAI